MKQSADELELQAVVWAGIRDQVLILGAHLIYNWS